MVGSKLSSNPHSFRGSWAPYWGSALDPLGTVCGPQTPHLLTLPLTTNPGSAPVDAYIKGTGYDYPDLPGLGNNNEKLGKDISRLSVKLKLLTGSYILQSKRIWMYKTETEATCLQCKDKEETMEHFILGCRCLETVRNPVLHELVNELRVWYWLLAA